MEALFSIAWPEPYRMIFLLAAARTLLNVYGLRVTISYEISWKMYSLKVPLMCLTDKGEKRNWTDRLKKPVPKLFLDGISA